MDLKEQEAIGDQIDSHWYYTSKAQMMADHIRRLTGGVPVKRVMDVGAGAGWFSRWMLREGLAETAVCVDPGYDRDWEELEAGRRLIFQRMPDGQGADLVLMMDVLEHVPDDAALLSEYLDVVAPGTPIFINIPAFPFLWSGHDVYLEHYRRYTLSRLKQTIGNAGAQADVMHYYFGAIFPAAAAVRLARRGNQATQSDMGAVPGPVNAALKMICGAERRIMRINRLAGLSAVALCRR